MESPVEDQTDGSMEPNPEAFQYSADEASVKTENEEEEEVKDEKENKCDSLGVKVKRKSRRGRSSGSLTMKGDKITSFTTERGVIYSPNDHVYIENNKPDQAYFLCSIQDFSVMKRDTLVVRVKWYWRVTEVPDNVYQHLVQDRYHQDVEVDHPLVNPQVKSRELFCSEAIDTYPVTALRGKCKVVHCNSLEAARSFTPAADTFYCILGYNPETKRLATTQGQIRVGSMYQARMPEYKPHVLVKDMPEKCEDREVFHWQPKSVLDGDLMMFLRAARSVAAFAGMCDGGSTEDGCQAASMDDTTMNAMNMLHKYEYDTGKALQALVKAPALRTIDKKWNEEDTKRFVKGLRLYGKNFFKIRKELLPHRETGELVEYYYYWKKSPAAAANRPHRRHRKHGVKRATTRSQRPASSEFLDLSSASDSDNDSEDSDSLGGLQCQNCFVTVSKEWSNAGKPNQKLCSKCRLFFKKYGVDRPLENSGDSPYFQPVKDGELNGAHNMLTRNNRGSTDSNKERKKGSNSVSSPDNLDSPTSDSKKSLVPSSPSALSTCSNSSTDKKRRSSVSPGVDKKRHLQSSDSEDKFSKRKRGGPSDSESISDSSISGAEETPNEADIETNHEELTSSSPPTTPSPVESDYKRDKSTPGPIPVESTIAPDKLSELPRPEPQHPSPNRQPLNIESSPLRPSLPQQIPSVPSVSPQIPSQGFVPLPPLPAFAFRPQIPPTDSLYQQRSLRHPFPEPLREREHKLSSDDKSSTHILSSATFPPLPHTGEEDRGDPIVISRSATTTPKIKEEVTTPPRSGSRSPMSRPMFIKQEPREGAGFMPKAGPNVTSGPSMASNIPNSANFNKDTFPPNKEPFQLLTPKLEPGLSALGSHSANLNPSGSHSANINPSGSHSANINPSGLHSANINPIGLHSANINTSGSHSANINPTGSHSANINPSGLHSANINPSGTHSANINPSANLQTEAMSLTSHSQDRVNLNLTSQERLTMTSQERDQLEVKNENVGQVQGQTEGEGERSEVEVMEESDSDSGDGTTTPGPTPTPCNKEILRSKSAIFIKLLNRGEYNSCSRCDLMFRPLPDSKLARRREDREKKVTTPVTPAREEVKRKAETPPPNPTADAQVVSTFPPNHHQHQQDRVTPRSSYHDTPALRQLSEYAKPHSMGQDPRAMAGYLGFSPFMDPIRMAAMYPPNSRERLELELERDKRERDARERELREHELRSIEMREKLKAELEMKPPGLERLLPPGANPLDPHWIEIQRRYGQHMLQGGSGSSHIPGIYPPTSLASDLMARERDRLERLGIPPGHAMLAESSYTAAIMERLSQERMNAERISAERMSADRFNAERLSAERLQHERMAMQDPLVRLQMSAGMSARDAAAAAAAAHAHTHTHAHSHTHLHLHEPDDRLAPPGGPPGGPPGPIPPSPGHPHHSLLPPHLLHQIHPDMLQSDQMTSRMIYQIYTQRLTHEQQVYMQRVSSELITRGGSSSSSLPQSGGSGSNPVPSKYDRPAAVDPNMSHLVYQFSRADPMSGVNGGSNQTPPGSMPSLHMGMPPHLMASREQELIQNDLYRRAYTDPALAQQLQAHHEAALQRMVMERERFGSGHLPPPH